MSIAIVGGGIMGISLAYYLARMGEDVEVFEAGPSLGGVAGPMTLPDGSAVDRFYHAILSSDSHLGELCQELGIADQLRFRETSMGFYHQGTIYPMNDVIQFLRFPPLNWIDRFRLGLTVLRAQLIRDWHSLEDVSVERWLVQLSGRHTYENIWRPLLKAKFDGDFDNVPATYIWARLVRMKSTRDGARQKESAGHLIGGYETLLRAMRSDIEARGGQIHLAAPVQELVTDGACLAGLRFGAELRPFEAVIVTLQPPLLRRLLPDAPPDYLQQLDRWAYLGVICPLLVLDRPLTGYWTLNITDERFPFTGVIETTAYIDPSYVGGHHLVYLPKYTPRDSPWQRKSDDEIREIWLANLEAMFPQFDRKWIRYFVVQRAAYVEPLHPLSSSHLIPSIETPVPGLFLATTAQIYPALTNGESVTRMAQQVARAVLDARAKVPAPFPCEREAVEASSPAWAPA